MNHRYLAALMIGCQIVLTAFVIQWLINQYKDERIELRNQLVHHFETSERLVLDTLIERNIIDPLLKNKDGFKIHIEDDSFTSDDSKLFIRKQVKKRSSSRDSSGREESLTVTALPSNDVLLQGVKLIVREVSTGNKSFEEKYFSISDTTMLRRHLDNSFRNKDWGFTMRWKQADSAIIHNDSGSFHFKSDLFPVDVEIGNTKNYLLGQILPQGIFALVLILMTGIAFLLSYRSLKNQLRLNRMKNDLIDNITHELKTPLTTVKVVVEALRNDQIRSDDKKTSDYLNMAALELNRLELLTSKVLNSSLMESGNMNMVKEEIDLLSIVQSVANNIRIRVEQQQSQIKIVAQPDNYKIKGDSLHIEGALLNIIDNSLKYGGAGTEIKISLGKKDGTIFIDLSDNGPGVPDEYIGKIFTKFFRVPSHNLHNIKGHGLGLNYVWMITELHNGKVSVKNLSPGILFHLEFPELR